MLLKAWTLPVLHRIPDESTQCSNKSVAVYTSFVRAPFAPQAAAPVMLQGQERALVPRNCPCLPGASHGAELDEPWHCCSHVWAASQTTSPSPGHLPCSLTILSEINDIKKSKKVSIPTTAWKSPLSRNSPEDVGSPGWSPALHRPSRHLLSAACRVLVQSPKELGAGSCYFGVQTELSGRAAVTQSITTLMLSGRESFTDPLGPEQWEVAAMCLPFCATRGSKPWI